MAVTLEGDTGNDTLTAATSVDHVIRGWDGDDSLTGAGGHDTISGNDGSDSLYGAEGHDQLFGGNNDDLAYGGGGNDTINASGLAYGGEGNDLMRSILSGGSSTIVDGGVGSADALQMESGSGGGFVDMASGLLGDGIQVFGIEILYATDFGDTMIGGLNTTLYGGDGADLVTLGSGKAYGDAGRDTINGTAEDGWADGGVGNDRIYGGSGDETLNGGDGRDSVVGGGGADELFAGFGLTGVLDTLLGGAGDDSLHLELTDNGVKAYGGDGRDLFITGDKAVTGDDLYGGGGTDTLDMSDAEIDTVILMGPAGTLTWGGFVNDLQDIENVTTGEGNDSIVGSAGANKIYGGSGRDTIGGGTGNDSLYGGDGDDQLTNPDGKVRMYGDAGNDRLVVWNLTDAGSRIDGGAGTGDTLVLIGTAPFVVDLVAGTLGIGSTSITLVGIENVDGNAQNDVIGGSNGANDLSGLQGNDTLRGNGGDDTIDGGLGSDSIDGGSGNDAFSRGTDSQDETVEGGGGIDTLTFTGVLGWAIGSIGTGIEFLGVSEVTISGVEVLVMTAETDSVWESGDINVIYAGGGADSVYDNGLSSVDDMFYGGTGRDVFDFAAANGDRVLDLATGAYLGNGGAFEFEDVRGGIWNDSVTGSAGDNVLAGAGGNDTLLGADGNDSLSGDAGRDSLVGGDGADTLAGGFEQDILFGDAKSDDLYGGSSADTLNGGGNGDMLDGGSENDLLSGNTGDDVLLGQAGRDRLVGGIGVDTLTGGADADGFIWAALAEGGVGEAADVVTDFATGDKLVLTGIGGLTWIDTAGFGGVAGQVRQSTTAGTTTVAIDSDGDRDADMEIVLQGHGAIVVGDLLL